MTAARAEYTAIVQCTRDGSVLSTVWANINLCVPLCAGLRAPSPPPVCDGGAGGSLRRGSKFRPAHLRGSRLRNTENARPIRNTGNARPIRNTGNARPIRNVPPNATQAAIWPQPLRRFCECHRRPHRAARASAVGTSAFDAPFGACRSAPLSAGAQRELRPSPCRRSPPSLPRAAGCVRVRAPGESPRPRRQHHLAHYSTSPAIKSPATTVAS
eukprot:SAG11_NODE_4695_length_1803_cov_1.308099_2_plen_214_part_00